MSGYVPTGMYYPGLAVEEVQHMWEAADEVLHRFQGHGPARNVFLDHGHAHAKGLVDDASVFSMRALDLERGQHLANVLCAREGAGGRDRIDALVCCEFVGGFNGAGSGDADFQRDVSCVHGLTGGKVSNGSYMSTSRDSNAHVRSRAAHTVDVTPYPNLATT